MHNPSNLPSTKELRAFEATVQWGSIKAAAEHLHVTASAISRRIQSLEDTLGKPLFVREVQGLTLTEAGTYYSEQLQQIFHALEQATNTVRQQEKQRLVVVAQSVIANELIENIAALEAAMPDVELTLHSFPGAPGSHPAIASADIVFSWGDADWEGWCSKLISARHHFVPVCAPGFLPDGMPFSTEALAEHPWIMTQHYKHTWEHWFRALGTPMPTPRQVIEVPNSVMARDAVRRGCGITMGCGSGGKADWGILSGEFVPAHAFHALAPSFGIRVHTRPHTQNTAIARFQKWLAASPLARSAVERGWAIGHAAPPPPAPSL